LFEIHLTPLAIKTAKAWYSVKAVEDFVRKEMRGYDAGSAAILNHQCLKMPGAMTYEFICMPDGGTGLMVDTCTFVETDEVMEFGLHKGEKVRMPRPDSDD
jgi:hypothetical protein